MKQVVFDFLCKAGETEHFWLTVIVYRNGKFEGVINNEPGLATNVKIGQKWTVKKGEISDWMFMRDGKMHGNYTMRPLLKTMPEEGRKIPVHAGESMTNYPQITQITRLRA